MREEKKRLFDSELTDGVKALDLLQCISRINDAIYDWHLDFHKKLDRVLRIVLEYLQVEQGSIMILEKGKLVVRAASRQEIIGVVQSLSDDSVAATVAKTGAPEFIQDISKDRRFVHKTGAGPYRTNSLLSVPIFHGPKVTGVFNVTDKSGNRDLLKEDIGYLLNFSSVILSVVVQQQMHEEIAKQKAILKKRNTELHRREAMQGELSRMLIHDLKGPLSEVVANLDILSYSVSGDNREFLEAAQLACDLTVRMASNLGTVAKIEDGKLRLIREEVEPQNLIEEAVTGIKGLARIKNITVQVLPTAESLPTLSADRVLILRVLQNLLTNALAYSPPATAITVGCSRQSSKRKVHFFVSDQGQGLNPEEQAIIFGKYARISSKQDALIGTGLGLYFCKLAVEEHRGRIWVESEPGQGCTFLFSLPY